jgi:hypothetical protein
MPGHMGDKQKTSLRLIVERVDAERNLLMVRGAVPGARNGMVTVKYSKGVKVAPRLTEEEWNTLRGVVTEEPNVIDMAAANEESEPQVQDEGKAE